MLRRIGPIGIGLMIALVLDASVATAEQERRPSIGITSERPFRLIDGGLSTSRQTSEARIQPASFCEEGSVGDEACDGAADSEEFSGWSTTELHFQYGKLDAPSFAGGRSAETRILTLQHASGWKYGTNFFFVDLLNDPLIDGFNDRDIYMELYSSLSLGAILDRRIGFGRISDVALLGGINFAADADVVKWLPGIRLSWDLPGFAFLNTDFMAFIDDTRGIAFGGNSPLQTDSFAFDVNWALPFSLGDHRFCIQGHTEFISGRRDEFGNDVHWWILAQPQFRYDLGNTLWGCTDKLFVGFEWQIWQNKLGDPDTDENVVQALVVWRL